MSNVRRNLFFASLLLSASAVAQYGGGYPPGQYPGGYPGGYPGRYPGAGGGIPFPRRNKQSKTTAKDQPVPLQKVSGQLQHLEQGSVTVVADDRRTITAKLSDTTKFYGRMQASASSKPEAKQDSKPQDNKKPSATPQPPAPPEIGRDTLKPGDLIRIEATQDNEGYLHAVSVFLEREGTQAERAEASQSEAAQVEVSRTSGAADPDKPAARAAAAPPGPEEHSVQHLPPLARTREDMDEDSSGPPRIQRGKQQPRTRARTSEAEPASAPAPAPPPPPQQTASAARKEPEWRVEPSAGSAEPAARAKPQSAEEAKLGKARLAVANYTASLPNYVCHEQMARFVSTSRPVDWRPIDVVATALVYDNGKEQYRDITINGKPVKKGMEEMTGAWSTGEFGTMTADLFSPATDADFQMIRHTTIAGRDASVFKFSVDQEHSHWRVLVPGQTFMPAYKGNVWIDDKTSQVLRVEMEAVQIPKAFPLDTVESAVDYEYTRIGEGQFLLPVHAETLSCVRGTSDCSRNVIDFRNYHKFSGESKITF